MKEFRREGILRVKVHIKLWVRYTMYGTQMVDMILTRTLMKI